MTESFQPSIFSILLPFLLTLVVLVLFHLLVNWVLPLRWPNIRGEFKRQLEKQIDELSVEASAGGGMVTVKMNGQKQLTEVRIEPDIFKSKDQEMLQDLIQGAVNEATRRVDEELSKQVKEISGGLPGVAGLKIPGLF